jgi:hypothetical protein
VSARHPLFAAACTLSAAIAYVDGWRVLRPRDLTLPVNMPPSIGADMADLVVFFADGGELEHLAHRQRFLERRSIAEHARMMQALFDSKPI